MLALGTEYQFSLDTAAYERLRRRSEYRWAEMRRLSHRPSLQFIGMGMEEIDLHGRIYPHYKGGLGQLDSMREAAGKGQPLSLVSGYGYVFGPCCITEIEEEQTVFAQRGAPRCIEFRLRLSRYGPDEEESAGTVSTTPGASKSLTTVFPF
jgi:phage protein U